MYGSTLYGRRARLTSLGSLDTATSISTRAVRTLSARCPIPAHPQVHPRLQTDKKSPGTSVWPLVPGYTTASGARQYPTAAIVASLAKPRGDKPALLGHFDTTLLFHEFGHLFHELLSTTRFARFHGTTGALDFAEAPSQMLENWWVHTVVRMVMWGELNRPIGALSRRS